MSQAGSQQLWSVLTKIYCNGIQLELVFADSLRFMKLKIYFSFKYTHIIRFFFLRFLLFTLSLLPYLGLFLWVLWVINYKKVKI